MKTEIQFSWDWKESPNIPNILKSAKEILEYTGQFPNCYEVDTQEDSYAILLSINKYSNAKEIRNKQRYLWIEENCSKEEFEQYKVENVVEFHAYGANGDSDPRDREGSNNICNDCSKKFSFWDDLNLNPYDEKLKCSNCKGIIIDLIRK